MWPKQREVHAFYTGHNVQIFVAVLIVFNFIFTCAEKEIDPYPVDLQHHRKVWEWGAAAQSHVACRTSAARARRAA